MGTECCFLNIENCVLKIDYLPLMKGKHHQILGF
jgi:hypothetical protein